jgi:AcrR family transcriptional regulator
MLFVMVEEPRMGLRERKKRETRQRISDAATMLIVARGFDNVTVAEIAEAAQVSKMTVFNYFPRKEDMFFDRSEEAVATITAAISDRAIGTSFVAALRACLLDLIEQRHPLSGLREGIVPFIRTVQDSPSLRAVARETGDALEQVLATLFAEETQARPEDPLPRVAAGLIIGAYRPVHARMIDEILAGRRIDELRPEHVARVDLVSGLLDKALGDYGVR